MPRDVLLDPAPRPSPPVAQRSVGTADVAVRRAAGASRLACLRTSGCLKLLWPRPDDPAEAEGVLVNTAGGLTGGDRLSIRAEVRTGARLLLTTPASERTYRAAAGRAEVDVHLTAAAGGSIAWLPQETIVYDGAALSRRMRVDLAEDARALVLEAFVLGREAMGETLTHGEIRDRWDVRRNQTRVYSDRLRITEDDWAELGRPSRLGPNRAFASLILVGADADSRLSDTRRLISGHSGASLVQPGVLLVRLRAPDGYLLRRALAPVLGLLSDRPLPAVWRF